MNNNKNIFLAVLSGIAVCAMCIVAFSSLSTPAPQNDIIEDVQEATYVDEYEEEYDEEIYDEDDFIEAEYVADEEEYYPEDENYFVDEYYEGE